MRVERSIEGGSIAERAEQGTLAPTEMLLPSVTCHRWNRINRTVTRTTTPAGLSLPPLLGVFFLKSGVG